MSGRHLCVSENLEDLLARIDEIERDDLHTLRLRTGTSRSPDLEPQRAEIVNDHGLR